MPPNASAPVLDSRDARIGVRIPDGACDPQALLDGSFAAYAVWPLAVEPRGRRAKDAPTIDDGLAWLAGVGRGAPVIPLLDHAGPAAFAWSKERAVGPTDRPTIWDGRRAEPLDDEAWATLVTRYAEAARRLVAEDIRRAVLGVDRDGLLSATLSPRTNPELPLEARITRVAHLVSLLADAGLTVEVALTVEERHPFGLDPSDGIAISRALVGAGASRIYASGGTAAFAPLSEARSLHDVGDPWLASAAWLPGQVAASVVAAGVSRSPRRALERALELGLDGVLVESATVDRASDDRTC